MSERDGSAIEGSGCPNPTLTVTPDSALFDEELSIRLTGVDPGTQVTLRYRETAGDVTVSASATFEANEDGYVDPGGQAPVAGDYTGIRPMGLVQFVDGTSRELADAEGPRDVTVEAVVDGVVVATDDCRRTAMADRVTVEEIGDDHEELTGDVVLPPGEGPHPGVLVLGGSSGGVPSGPRTALLASHGYAVLALAYFGVGNLPEHLVDIPMEYFETAVEWFTDHEAVRRDPLGVFGASRGSEPALWLAANRSEVRTAVALAPSHVLFEGIWLGKPSEYDRPGAAWTYDGEDLPYVPIGFSPVDVLRYAAHWVAGRPVAFDRHYRAGIETADPGRRAAATIPVERIDGPVLVISGTEDRMWDASAHAEAIIARLEAADYSRRFEHIDCEGAGHAIRHPYVPVHGRESVEVFPRLKWAFGGSAEGYAEADTDAWNHVLEFLDEGLRSDGT